MCTSASLDAKEEDSDGEKQEDMEEMTDSFRAAVHGGMQVALLVNDAVEGVPFLVGDVKDGQGPGQGPLCIHWYSPVTKGSMTGKWTPDYLSMRAPLEPSEEERERNNIIPVTLRWARPNTVGFKRGVGGTLTKHCLTLIQECIDQLEVEQLYVEQVHVEADPAQVSHTSRKRKQPVPTT
jgi:hypothetical protein